MHNFLSPKKENDKFRIKVIKTTYFGLWSSWLHEREEICQKCIWKKKEMVYIEQESLWLVDNGELKFLVKYPIRSLLSQGPEGTFSAEKLQVKAPWEKFSPFHGKFYSRRHGTESTWIPGRILLVFPWKSA